MLNDIIIQNVQRAKTREALVKKQALVIAGESLTKIYEHQNLREIFL